jgi:hypothetical protein
VARGFTSGGSGELSGHDFGEWRLGIWRGSAAGPTGKDGWVAPGRGRQSSRPRWSSVQKRWMTGSSSRWLGAAEVVKLGG